MGYGKTVLAIALHEVRQDRVAELSEVDEKTSFRCAATLVCIPAHLIVQWQQEIKKFTGNKNKLLSLSKKADLQKSTLRSFLEADIILCNYELLRSTHYADRRNAMANAVCPPKAPRFQTAVKCTYIVIIITI